MKIVPDTSDPRKYAQISEILETQIALGVLEPGEIVTITELAEEFEVARQTARRAIRVIEGKGLLASCGTAGFVVTPKCPTCGQWRQENARQQ